MFVFSCCYGCSKNNHVHNVGFEVFRNITSNWFHHRDHYDILIGQNFRVSTSWKRLEYMKSKRVIEKDSNCNEVCNHSYLHISLRSKTLLPGDKRTSGARWTGTRLWIGAVWGEVVRIEQRFTEHNNNCEQAKPADRWAFIVYWKRPIA